MAHRKHTKLIKPKGGQWGRNEVAIMGAPCGEIKKLVAELTQSLANQLQIAYVDADHNAPETNDWSALNYGANAQLTNKISHYAIELASTKSHYFNEADLVIVNGNHFQAQTQVAWIHPKKSLAKKLEKLNNVDLIILDDDEIAIPDYLADHLTGKDFKVLKKSDKTAIKAFFLAIIQQNKPALNGLVLIGGKSTRMHKDKSKLVYHKNLPQHEYLTKLLDNYCENVFVSVRDETQAAEYDNNIITDKFINLGPYGGILSALQHNPNSAWLVVAVDLPYLDEATISNLVTNRNTSKAATCFIDPKNEFPEPLITIWEPRAYPILLEFLAKGYSCPRKALINSDVEVIIERDVKSLTNVYTPEELEETMEKIHE
jgi:molybdopterin-guanine dinucleotide biosynthesis protein A